MPELISREDARANKLTRYFTGKPCPKNHVSERMTSNSVCVACAHVRQRLKLKTDKEYARTKRKLWRLNSPDWYMAQNEKWRERRKQLTKKWRANNKERHLKNQRNAQKRHEAANSEKTFSRRVLVLAVKYGIVNREPCQVCGALDAEAHHTDYYKPLQVLWLCRKHHQEAHNE